MEGIVTVLKSGEFGASGSQLRRQIRSTVGQLEMKSGEVKSWDSRIFLVILRPWISPRPHMKWHQHQTPDVCLNQMKDEYNAVAFGSRESSRVLQVM